ncbi:MAG: 2-amino-4-hydroxy-6-hydroxymethyldihydropteridine diphosphokinase [Magnetococcales bacterium]|nr:2-amino-4-hydroxy-6-hydroxymethyldihydropteridine diphosphokinase [Magnetococcales bacterium]
MAWIGVGSNQGPVRYQIDRALTRLQRHGRVLLLRCSPWYRTEPVGLRQQPWFTNGVILIATTLAPQDLLHLLHRIERQRGRDRGHEQPWGPRPLDLDLLLYGHQGETVMERTTLVLPHPRMHQRRFVLQPLVDLTPTLVHPLQGKTVDRLLAEVDDSGRIKRLGRR